MVVLLDCYWAADAQVRALLQWRFEESNWDNGFFGSKGSFPLNKFAATICAPYKDEYYYFEIFEGLYKMSIVGLAYSDAVPTHATLPAYSDEAPAHAAACCCGLHSAARLRVSPLY